jgi:hypothetical protein
MTEKKKRGRPRKQIDPDQVEKLAGIQCSYEEMAAVLDCSVKTLQRNYVQAIEKGRENGRASLKRKQFEMAMKGDRTMLVWLGKQYLSQTDKRDIQHDIKGGVMVVDEQKETKKWERLIKEQQAMSLGDNGRPN